MDLLLYNTLSRKKEVFEPLKKDMVTMYNCGPTVYDRQHIGNLRAAVAWDVLRRVLEFNSYKVVQTVNITDIGHLSSDSDEGEDKMTKGLKREGMPLTLDSMKQLARKYTDVYIEDRKRLNILKPSHLPFASEHINESINMIETLVFNGFAYITKDGVYFDTAKDPNYGKLLPTGIDVENAKQQSRVSGSDVEKKNLADFALWKFDNVIGWDSPWGKGFPGWHIECSSMSRKYLGDTFDIHTGGIEHIPVHHTNEIAQSENATGKPMARYWLHNEWLHFKDIKMSKSKGNVVYLSDLEAWGYSSLDLRHLFLQAHYRSPLFFSTEALEASSRGLKRLKEKLLNLSVHDKDEESLADEDYLLKFNKYMLDDLDSPKALALVYELVDNTKIDSKKKYRTILEIDRVLALGLTEPEVSKEDVVPKSVEDLVWQREEARKKKDWKLADDLREKIVNLGYEIKDTNEGSRLKKIKNNFR
jgi:cysteinyl-tRNA synthetase